MNSKPVFRHEIIVILRSFSSVELRKFGRFLESPYFSYRPSLKKLFDELVRFHPLYTDIKLDRQFLYKKVYPGRRFNDDSMRDLLSSLHNAACTFLSYENFASAPASVFNLFKELSSRNLVSQLSKQLEESSRAMENSEGVDSDYFMMKFRVTAELFNFDEIAGRLNSKDAVINLAERVKLASIYIIIYFISELVTNYTNLIINADRFSSASLDEQIYSSIKGFSPEKLFSGFRGLSKYDFMVDIYKSLLNTFLKRGSWNAYSNYKKEVLKNRDKFSFDETSFHFGHMIGSAILGTKYGRFRAKFENELLWLYMEFVEKRLFVDKKVKYIPMNLFRTMIFHGVNMNSFPWLEKMISAAVPNLPPDERENMHNYALAQYTFASGRFDDSLDYLNKLSLDSFIFKYDLYEIKMRIYYEREMYEPALELIHTYRQFIRKDPIVTASRKTFHRNFVYYIEKLVKASLINSRVDVDMTVFKLDKLNNIYHKAWLVERFNSLEKPGLRYRKSV